MEERIRELIKILHNEKIEDLPITMQIAVYKLIRCIPYKKIIDIAKENNNDK